MLRMNNEDCCLRRLWVLSSTGAPSCRPSDRNGVTWGVILNEEHPMGACPGLQRSSRLVSGLDLRPCLGLYVPAALGPRGGSKGD